MDDDIKGLVVSLIVAIVDSQIAFRIAKDDYQAALQCGVSPDLARVIAQENFLIARERLISKVSEHANACADWMMQEYALQADAAGPSSSQQAPVPQDVTDASEETLQHKRNTAATEETVERDTSSQEEVAENDMIAPEETVEHSRPKKAAQISDLY